MIMMRETAENVRFEGLLNTTKPSDTEILEPKEMDTLQNNHSKHTTTESERNSCLLTSSKPLTLQHRPTLPHRREETSNRPTASKMRMLQLKAMRLNQQKNTTICTRLETLLAKYSRSILLMLASNQGEAQHLPKPFVRAKTCTKFRFLPSLGATSFLTLLTLICLEMILLSTVSNCAKTFYMHWNTSNSIFRIDNTDHIIDVNKGNLAFEFDQVHIICPVYEPGTFENETEKYIIYNVSKVEYETCRITNADPRVIAICDKPQKLMFFTITFRPFTPQPGGLEFLPGNDYYFISTSSKDDLYRRIGGRCSTNNMKVVFKVCCAPEEKNKTTTTSTTSIDSGSSGSESDVSLIDVHSSGNANNKNNNNQQHNTINSFGGVGGSGGGININSANNNGIQLKPLNVGGSSGTSINTNIDQFNRIPMQTNGINVIGHNIGPMGGDPHSGILLTPGGVGHGGINMIPASGGYNPGMGGQYYPGQTTTGIRINNVPSQYHPSHKHNNNNGKDVEEQEIAGGGVDVKNHLPPHFLPPPIIDTNHSNIVKSTINWPPTQNWSGNSNSNKNNYSHNTQFNQKNIQNHNISISANDNHFYHSTTPHRPTSITSTNHNMKNSQNKNDHYDKHPNEVVKNEELTYNSAGSTIHRHCWSWRKIVHFEAVLAAAGSSSLATNLKRSLMKLENLIISLIFNPLVLLTIFFVTIVQYQFFNTSYYSPFAKVEGDKRRSKQPKNCKCISNHKFS